MCVCACVYLLNYLAIPKAHLSVYHHQHQLLFSLQDKSESQSTAKGRYRWSCPIGPCSCSCLSLCSSVCPALGQRYNAIDIYIYSYTYKQKWSWVSVGTLQWQYLCPLNSITSRLMKGPSSVWLGSYICPSLLDIPSTFHSASFRLQFDLTFTYRQVLFWFYPLGGHLSVKRQI